MRKKLIVAIDGPAGAGKSTIAKIVAKELKYLYIDTGAMYRALTWKVLTNKISLSDKEKIVKMAKASDVNLKQRDDKLRVFLDGKDVTDKIRSEMVSRVTNTVASIGGVRKVLRNIQRQIGLKGGVVMEGRDIGTIVFPDADIKFYLDAKPMERAKRRYKELKAKGQKVSLKKIAKALTLRDWKDRNRGISPLRCAKDAIVIDSTDLTLTQVAHRILDEIENFVDKPSLGDLSE